MPNRFIWLDSLRGLASIVVLIYHYHHFYLSDSQSRSDLPSTSVFPYTKIFQLIYEHGGLAVQLFWVISGFVFYHVYLNKPTSIWKFIVHRIARLYPLHLLTLLLVALLQFVSMHYLGWWQVYGNNNVFHFVLHLFFASNSLFVSHGLSFNGPIWSVSLEIFSYFIFIVCLPLLRKTRASLTCAILALCILVLTTTEGDVLLFSSGVIHCMTYFFVGGLAYLAYKELIAKNIFLILGELSAVLVLIFVLSAPDFLGHVFATVCGCAALVILVASLDHRVSVNLGFMKALGDSSYSLYLVHVPLQMIVLLCADLFLNGTRSFAESWLTLPIYVLVSLVSAHYIYVYFEKPAGKIVRKLLL